MNDSGGNPEEDDPGRLSPEELYRLRHGSEYTRKMRAAGDFEWRVVMFPFELVDKVVTTLVSVAIGVPVLIVVSLWNWVYPPEPR